MGWAYPRIVHPLASREWNARVPYPLYTCLATNMYLLWTTAATTYIYYCITFVHRDCRERDYHPCRL